MLSVQKAGIEQISLIHQLAYQIWPVAYQTILSATQITYMLQLIYSTGALEKQMHEGQTFYILFEKEMPVGFVAFGLYGINTYKLHKIYVLPEKQGSGLGKKLLQFVIDSVRSTGARALILNVNRQNKALSFYKKAGFIIMEETDVAIGNGYWMNDYIMRLML